MEGSRQVSIFKIPARLLRLAGVWGELSFDSYLTLIIQYM